MYATISGTVGGRTIYSDFINWVSKTWAFGNIVAKPGNGSEFSFRELGREFDGEEPEWVPNVEYHRTDGTVSISWKGKFTSNRWIHFTFQSEHRDDNVEWGAWTLQAETGTESPSTFFSTSFLKDLLPEVCAFE